VREAEVGELEATPGIGPELARVIHDTLHDAVPSERRVSA
jgi:hypothetical protein